MVELSNVSNSDLFLINLCCIGRMEDDTAIESEVADQGQGGGGRRSYLRIGFVRHHIQQFYRVDLCVDFFKDDVCLFGANM